MSRTAHGRHPGPHDRQRPLRVRAWWVMRERAAFSLADLLHTVADGSERNAAHNLRQYIRALEHSGVLARAYARAELAAWRLARDLGPLAPVAQRCGRAVRDPNNLNALITQESDRD
jgi:hypothetical protein